jgi:hypothetical protein
VDLSLWTWRQLLSMGSMDGWLAARVVGTGSDTLGLKMEGVFGLSPGFAQ